MKTIMEIIDERATCRNYQETKIPEGVMDQILNAACQAPSGGGFQNFSIIRVSDSKKRDRLSELCRGQKMIAKAPESLVFCIDYRRSMRISQSEPFPYDEHQSWFSHWMTIIDAAISAQSAVLTAESLGLKSVYVGNILIQIEEASKLLNLPKYVVPVIMLTIGYPKVMPKISKKFDRKILVHDNTYEDLPQEKLMKAYHDKYSDWKMRPKSAVIDKIYVEALRQGGGKLRDAVKEWIEENQTVSPYQYWFGAYYSEDRPPDLKSLIDYLKNQGIDIS